MHTHNSTAISSQNMPDASTFHARANKKKGVVVSTCTMDQSGCHCFGESLRQTYGLDFIAMKVVDSAEISKVDVKLAADWQQIVITGCKMGFLHRAVETLTKKHDCRNVTNIDVVTPPHLSRDYVQDYAMFVDFFSCRLQGSGYSVTLFTAGFDLNCPHSIGVPAPCTLSDSKLDVENHCFGLMYHRHPIECEKYLTAYFKQVKMATKESKGEATITAINLKNASKDKVDFVAKQHKIKVNHVEKIPHAEFMNMIKVIAAKGGIISTDGTQTHMEALHLGANALCYVANPINADYYQDFIRSLPAQHVATANVLLGQSNQYTLLDDQKQVIATSTALKLIVGKCIRKFDNDRIVGSMFKGSFETAIKQQLQRITHIEWRYAQQKNKAFLILKDPAMTPVILEYLRLKGLSVEKNRVKGTREDILIVNCAKIKISELIAIEPMKPNAYTNLKPSS